jgi:hypothetical protein
MFGVSLGSWLLATAAAPARINPEVLLGMVGPLAAASVTWIVTARTFAVAPERLMARFVAGFAGKMVFFALYVALMLRLLDLRPVLFVASFAAYFIVLLIMQAVCMHRLFERGAPPWRAPST